MNRAMFARCCRCQIPWRVPKRITPSRGLVLVRNISSGTSTLPEEQDSPAEQEEQDFPDAASPPPALMKVELADRLRWEKKKKSQFISKTAHFLGLELVPPDPENPTFLYQYLPQERRLVYTPGKEDTRPKIAFRVLYNDEPTRKWKVKLYDAALTSIRKSIASVRQVRGHLHGAQNRIFALNKIPMENIGLLAPGPEPQGDDDYPNVDVKDLRMLVERDAFNQPVLLWVSIAHLESERLAMGQWASKILNPPRIWQHTLNKLARGFQLTPETDDFTWILDRFSDTIMETVKQGPGRTLFNESKTPPIPLLPVVFSMREWYFWFLWRDPPNGPMDGQYAGSWIPRLPGVLPFHEARAAHLKKHESDEPPKETKRPWKRTVQKRPTGRMKKPKDGAEAEAEPEPEPEPEVGGYNKDDWW